jgi:DHA1 family multidrug resistance protein-like MFS transporter
VDTLKMTSAQTGIMVTAIGLINIFTQAVGLRWLVKRFKNSAAVVTVSLLASAITMVLMATTRSIPPFLLVLFGFALFSSPINALTTGLLSERTKKEDQGGILGINQSYTSLGQVIGPLLAGFIAAKTVIGNIFFLAAAFFGVAVIMGILLFRKPKHKLDL